MVENKYQIKFIKFGLINWVGFTTLYLKEISRFLVVWAQTILSPLVSSLLFLSVLTLAIGNEKGNVLDFPFIVFLAPGLIVMSMVQQSFSHSVSSLMIAKESDIVDISLTKDLFGIVYSLRISNLFNENYEKPATYNQEGRQFRLGFKKNY